MELIYEIDEQLVDPKKNTSPITTIVSASGGSIDISLEGYQTACYARGQTTPIINIELYDGDPYVTVYADVNSEEPTHRIKLSGAHQDAYVEEE